MRLSACDSQPFSAAPLAPPTWAAPPRRAQYILNFDDELEPQTPCSTASATIPAVWPAEAPVLESQRDTATADILEEAEPTRVPPGMTIAHPTLRAASPAAHLAIRRDCPAIGSFLMARIQARASPGEEPADASDMEAVTSVRAAFSEAQPANEPFVETRSQQTTATAEQPPKGSSDSSAADGHAHLSTRASTLLAVEPNKPADAVRAHRKIDRANSLEAWLDDTLATKAQGISTVRAATPAAGPVVKPEFELQARQVVERADSLEAWFAEEPPVGAQADQGFNFSTGVAGAAFRFALRPQVFLMTGQALPSDRLGTEPAIPEPPVATAGRAPTAAQANGQHASSSSRREYILGLCSSLQNLCTEYSILLASVSNLPGNIVYFGCNSKMSHPMHLVASFCLWWILLAESLHWGSKQLDQAIKTSNCGIRMRIHKPQLQHGMRHKADPQQRCMADLLLFAGASRARSRRVERFGCFRRSTRSADRETSRSVSGKRQRLEDGFYEDTDRPEEEGGNSCGPIFTSGVHCCGYTILVFPCSILKIPSFSCDVPRTKRSNFAMFARHEKCPPV